jgi:hypothetical protein
MMSLEQLADGGVVMHRCGDGKQIITPTMQGAEEK